MNVGTNEPPAKLAKVDELTQNAVTENKPKSPPKKQQKKPKKKSPKAAHPPTKQYGPKQLTLLQKVICPLARATFA